MSLQKLIHNYSAFNLWANEQFTSWLQNIDVSLLTQSVPSSFTSIDYTIQHILRTQKFWTTFISEQDYTSFDWSVKEGQTRTMIQELAEQSHDMHNRFLGYDDAALNQKLFIHTPWSKGELPRYEYMQHVINHSTYHRGQIVTIARSIGITENIPGSDYNLFNFR